MNMLNEQGSYWVANTFIWNWLLLPILPLSDLIKQDIASSLQIEEKKPFWLKLTPYLTYTCITLLIWSITIPGTLHYQNVWQTVLIYHFVAFFLSLVFFQSFRLELVPCKHSQI